MNFQEKVIEATARRVDGLKKSIAVLNVAGRQFNQVARRHASHFVKQNSPLIAAVRKDVSQLARSTFATLTKAPAPKKTRRPAAARKRAAKAA